MFYQKFKSHYPGSKGNVIFSKSLMSAPSCFSCLTKEQRKGSRNLNWETATTENLILPISLLPWFFEMERYPERDVHDLGEGLLEVSERMAHAAAA